MTLSRAADVSAVLKDSVSGLGLAAQTLTATETPQGGTPTPIPNMTTDPSGTAIQTVTVTVPATYTFAVSYAGGTVGGKTYAPGTGSTTLHIGTKTLSGKVSAEVAPGEMVTITLTRPDGTTETLLAATQSDLSFSVEMDDAALGNYSAIAKIASDGTYSAASASATTTL